MLTSGRWITAAILCFALGGCGGHPDKNEKPASALKGTVNPEVVILTIGEESFSNGDFQEYVALASAGEDLSPDILSRFFDSFVEEKLLLAEARRRAMSLSSEEKRAYLARLHRQLGSEIPEADPEQIASGLLLEKLLVEKLTIELTAGIEIDPEEIQAYYIENKRDFLRSEMVRVSQILLSTEDQAVGIYDRIKQASEDEFRKTAREESQGMEASGGGAMGVFELGQLPLEMEKVIFALKPGEISRVFESSYGFHIFRLDEKLNADLIEPEDAAPQIEMILLENKVAECLAGFLRDLRDRFDLTIHPEKLPFTYQKDSI